MDAIKNLDNVIKKIESARLKVNQHQIVQIVAVSKYSSSDEIRQVYKAGQRAFGESRVQDFRKKAEELQDLPIQWHFIGRLQKNKINNLIDLNPFLFHSLDSLELAEELDKKLKIKNKKLNTLLQINSSYEESKAGVKPEEAIQVYKIILEKYTNINLIGVMSIGAYSDDKTKIKDSFLLTNNIFKELQPFGARICSMGMSGDFEIAIECGSNLVRIGSAIFKESN